MVWIFLLILGLVVGVLEFGRWTLSRRLKRQQRGDYRAWRFVRAQGGATVESPYSMTESEALQFCAQTLGVVMYVDRAYSFVFYRPHT